MTDFEVTIVSPDAKSVSITLSVKADNWVQAWHEGLSIMGAGEVPKGASCVLGEDRAIHIHVPGSRRTFIVRQVVEGDPVTARGPRPKLGTPMRVDDLLDQRPPAGVAPAAPGKRPIESTEPMHKKVARPPLRRQPPGARRNGSPERDAPRPRAATPTPPAPDDGGPRPGTAATTSTAPSPSPDETIPVLTPPRFDDDAANVPGVVDGQPIPNELRRTVDDPVVRVLNELERARLKARPVRLSPDTGMPQSADLPATSPPRRGEQTVIGRPAPKTGHKKRPNRTRNDTAAFSALRRSDPLPQQFHAIDPSAAGATTPADVLRQAIDTAWQHIPCRMAQVLRHGGSKALDVTAARGERARELVSCRVHTARSFSQLSSGKPARIKFSGDPARIRYQTPDGGVFDEPVRSALCVPVQVAERDYAVFMLLDATRESGSFADGELRALSYLAKTVERSLASAPPNKRS